jgi:hypothetical protein
LALFPRHPVLVSGAADLEEVEDVEVVALVDLRQRLFLARMGHVAGAVEENRIDPGK